MWNERSCVIIESQFRGDTETNVVYADCLMMDSIARGEAPFLGHLLYPRVLNDLYEIDRRGGIECHLAWLSRAQAIIVGMDLGVPSSGMQAAIELGEKLEIPVEERYLGPDWITRLELRRTPGFR